MRWCITFALFVHEVNAFPRITLHVVNAFPRISMSAFSLCGTDAHYYRWCSPCSIAVMGKVKWWPTWLLCLSELQVLGYSRRILLRVFISRQGEPLCVPDAYVISLHLTLPRRLFSITVIGEVAWTSVASRMQTKCLPGNTLERGQYPTH